jgi:preprotein translocase subunit SecD
LNNPTRFFHPSALVLAAALAFLSCVSHPNSSHVLEFALVAEKKPGAFDVDYTPRGGTPVRLSLEQPKHFAVAHAVMSQDESTGDPALSVEFAPEGSAELKEWTGRNLERRLAVLLDRQVLLVATIQGALFGKATFTRSSPPFTASEVQDVVESLNTGL